MRASASRHRELVRTGYASVSSFLIAILLIAPTQATTPPAPGEAAAQDLEMARQNELSGDYTAAEAGYLRVIEQGGVEARQVAAGGLERVARLRTDQESSTLMELGDALQRGERPAEAEVVYRQVVASSTSSAVKAEALRRLKTLIAFPPLSSAGAEIALAKEYEQRGRLADSESAYSKALDSGSDAQKRDAIHDMESVIERRDGIVEKYVRPTWEGSVKVITPIALLALLVIGIRFPLRAAGRRFHRNMLTVSNTWQPPGGAAVGAGFGETLTTMHERMSSYFRARSPVGTAGKMRILLRSSGSEFIELISGVNASAGPIMRWCLSAWRQPTYVISGSTESTDTEIRVSAKLEHGGTTVAHWTRIHNLRGWFASEQDLAYEILLTLKEYADANAP